MNPKEASTPAKEMSRAILNWWRTKRPVGWRVEKHRRFYSVNCVNAAEGLLAKCASQIRRTR